MIARPLRISIHALGGQGGGVLADWIVHLAEAEGWYAQATSVPGVAQRTGSTIYYVELAPPGPEPVMALMPTPGDVDIVLAAELMEAGRAIARGLVTPDRTVLIASSHRVFAIGEKSAMGDGVVSPADVLEAAGASSKRLVLADLAALAEAHDSVISATMFGALASSGALPCPRSAFENAIRGSGKGVERSLRAFAATAEFADHSPARPLPHEEEDVRSAATPAQLRGRIKAELPAEAVPLAHLGAERLTDYQDAAYASLYLDRLAALARADRELGGVADGHALTAAAARHLALWMAFEDVIWVADLKTRPARFARVAAEARLKSGQIAHTTEYMHPRYEELCDMAPARLGERLLRSRSVRRWLAPVLSKGRFVTTSRLPGFFLLWAIARLRGYRRRTYRYSQEQQRIEAWLASAVNAARTDYGLGLEILKLQRLVKGYGETHERGLRNFSTILTLVPRLAEAGEPARRVAELHEAALKDDEGIALGRAIRAQERQTGLPIGAPVIVHAKE